MTPLTADLIFAGIIVFIVVCVAGGVYVAGLIWKEWDRD